MKRKRKFKIMPGFFTRIFIILGVTKLQRFLLSSFCSRYNDVQGKYFTDEEISNMAHAIQGRTSLINLIKEICLIISKLHIEARVYRVVVYNCYKCKRI